jgi:hypothetical protein
MASPDQINNRSDLAGAPEKTMENLNTVTLNTENTLAAQIAALAADATQLQIESIVKDQSITSIVGIDHVGQRLSGSAERAIAALINFRLADAMAAADKHWSKVEHRETGDLAKALTPMKTEFFTAHKGHSNPSTKWARIRVMAYELSNPKITAPIGEGEEGAEGEGAGDSATSRTRDLYSRYVIELGKLYRAGNSAENDAVIKAHVNGDKIIAALEAVTTALKALGAPLEDDDLKAFMAKHK